MLPLLLLTALAAEPVLAPHQALTHATAERVVIEGFLWHVVTPCPPCPEHARCEPCLDPFDGVFLAPQREMTERPVPGIQVAFDSRPRDFTRLMDTLVRVTGDLQVSGDARWVTGATVEQTAAVAESLVVSPGEAVTTPGGVAVQIDAKPVIGPHHKTGAYTLRVNGDEVSFQANPLLGEWALGGYRVAARPEGDGIRLDIVPGTPPPLGSKQLEQAAWFEAAFRGIERSRTAVGGGPGLYVAHFYAADQTASGTLYIGTLTGRVYD